MAKKFSIDNINVYGISESITASGLPLSINAEPICDVRRMERLATAPAGSGHDCALKGILVQFDVTYPVYWSPQAQRYHWFDIVSSQSSMHRLTKFNLDESFNEFVDEKILDRFKELVYTYNISNGKDEASYKTLISSCPQGLMKTMRVSTNYLQLKTIYNQRKNHKLDEWNDFCNFIEHLPYSNFITK